MLTFWTKATPDDVKILDRAVKRFKLNARTWKDVHNLLVPEEGELIVAMGAAQIDLMKRAGIVPKNLSVNKLRGQAFPYGKGHYMVTFSPSIVFVDASKEEEVYWDIQLAGRFYSHKTMAPVLGDYKYVRDLTELKESIEALYAATNEPVRVSVDLETMGLYPYYPDKKIVSISFTEKPGVAHVVYTLGDWSQRDWRALMADVNWVLNTDKVKVVGANLKYDMVWLAEKWGIECTNFTMDTLMTGSLLNENRSNSLNLHAKSYTTMGGYDDDFNRKYDKGKMELIPKDALLSYAGGDTDACLRVSESIIGELKEKRNLSRLYVRILHPAVRAFEKIERRGLLVDQEKFAQLDDDLSKEISSLESQAFDMMPTKIVAKYRDNLSLGRSIILKDFLFTHPSGLKLKPKMVTAAKKEPSTAADHLSMFEDHAVAGPFIKLLGEWNGAVKTQGTYVRGFLNHLRPDGRFHPTYMLYNGSMYGDDKLGGTTTGRTSAKDPAVQTLPKHTKWAKRLRECYIAPPGFKFFQCDFSQGELRVTACVANEKTMLEAYRNGKDLHAVTGAKLAGMDYDEFFGLKETDEDVFDMYRSRAKPANFGLLYGMGANGYREYARTGYNLVLTEAEAEQQRGAFFDLYSGLLTWHDNYKAIARNFGMVESPLKRVRHLPLINSKDNGLRSQAERQAINSPIQSCLSDMCLWAISLVEDRYASDGLYGDLQIVGMTHDSIYGYVREDRLDLVARVIDVMQALPFDQFDWEPQIPFPADAEIGDTLATLKKVRF